MQRGCISITRDALVGLPTQYKSPSQISRFTFMTIWVTLEFNPISDYKTRLYVNSKRYVEAYQERLRPDRCLIVMTLRCIL